MKRKFNTNPLDVVPRIFPVIQFNLIDTLQEEVLSVDACEAERKRQTVESSIGPETKNYVDAAFSEYI